MFEVADIGPGFDVGAHLHRNAQELFYVLEGQLGVLAFEPRIRPPGGWRSWDLTRVPVRNPWIRDFMRPLYPAMAGACQASLLPASRT